MKIDQIRQEKEVVISINKSKYVSCHDLGTVRFIFERNKNKVSGGKS